MEKSYGTKRSFEQMQPMNMVCRLGDLTRLASLIAYDFKPSQMFQKTKSILMKYVEDVDNKDAILHGIISWIWWEI